MSVSINSQFNHLSKAEKIQVWIYEHPTTVKAIKIVSLILGLGICASLPFSAPIIGVISVVSLAITGALLIIASVISLLVLDILVPPHHDMKTHMYKTGVHGQGSLKYEGHVPVLTLNYDKGFFKAGEAHGFLCGAAMEKVMSRFRLALHTLGKAPRAHMLQETIKAVKAIIPKELLSEMKGIIAGYDIWRDAQPCFRRCLKISLDDLILIHLLPDSLHFSAGAYENAVPACTSIVEKDTKANIVFARNMDWPSLGVAGRYTLCIKRQHPQDSRLLNSLEVSIPGCVGTLTGMNSAGLSLAMNVCSGMTSEVRGIPASLNNRVILTKCRDVPTVQDHIDQASPLGPYHLTAADKTNAIAISFFQDSLTGVHVVRSLETGSVLDTFNYRYGPFPSSDVHHSRARAEQLTRFLAEDPRKPLRAVLTRPYINNSITTQTVVMHPARGVMDVVFDDAYAGDKPLHTVGVS